MPRKLSWPNKLSVILYNFLGHNIAFFDPFFLQQNKAFLNQINFETNAVFLEKIDRFYSKYSCHGHPNNIPGTKNLFVDQNELTNWMYAQIKPFFRPNKAFLGPKWIFCPIWHNKSSISSLHGPEPTKDFLDSVKLSWILLGFPGPHMHKAF